MTDILKVLLESDSLDESLKKQLQESWDQKLQETRDELRSEVMEEARAEVTRRYETDREKMVEAMNMFITEKVEEELRELNEDRKELYAARAKLAKEIRETKQERKRLVAESSKVLEEFALKKIKTELKEFMIDKKNLVEERKKSRKALNEQRNELNAITGQRIKGLEKFIVKKLSEEISEFETDKQELVEQKVRMAREAKKKLDETRRTFVERSSKLVEKTLSESLTKEFTQFREDIAEARQNHFGRKLFEAFASEYMSSHYAEGSEVKKLEGILAESKGQTSRALSQLKEQQNLIKSLQRRVQLTESSAKREKVMSRLLSPLGRDNRHVMEEILSNVKTERLEEAFKKHLPSVLNENKSNPRGGKTTLKETATPRKSIANGNRKAPEANVETKTTEEPNAEVIRLQALAGIK